MQGRHTTLTALLALAGAIFGLPAQAQIAVRNQGYMPFADEPINYRSEDLSDPVARLEKQVERATRHWSGKGITAT